MKSILVFLFVILYQCCCNVCTFVSAETELTCSVSADEDVDPKLKEMKYNVGDGEQSMMAYIDPDIRTYYKDGKAPASTRVTPKNKGLAGKVINMSNQIIRVFWEARVGDPNPTLHAYLGPFEVTGTATFTGHFFFFAKDDGKAGTDNLQDSVLKRFQIGEYPNNYYFYDPYYVEDDPAATEANLAQHLSPNERELYDEWHKTLLFNEQYLNFTGRTYLANYLRKPPSHFMWRADYFGQEHWVTTKETHFVDLPKDKNELKRIRDNWVNRKLEPKIPRLLSEYRDPTQHNIMNMTLKVLSVAPRVFEIPNFLSEVEVDHILDLAGGITLSRSSVGQVGSLGGPSKSSTRTSLNSWVPREKSPIIDAIYRRAADLLRIDESLFRQRGPDEAKDYESKSSLAEQLQLVHYSPGQEYTAHHDFGFSGPRGPQGARFSTLLLYLNGNVVGGETSFPRWQNAETFDQLKVAPEAGKAVLFYSQLPDGNLDDFSHHAALPVREGEKWLINLWVWDPVYK